jgi:SAM-dependent methyltransferase
MRTGLRVMLAGVQLSLLMTFLPRWTAAHGLVLERLPNAVLLAALLGLTVGLLHAGEPDPRSGSPGRLGTLELRGIRRRAVDAVTRRSFLAGAVTCAALTGFAALPWPPVRAAVPVAVVLTAVLAATYGAHTGAALRRAHRAGWTTPGTLALGVVGGLLGVSVDAGLSAAAVPPLGWALLLAVGMVLAHPSPDVPTGLVVWWSVTLTVVGVANMADDTTWTPYGATRSRDDAAGTSWTVNGVAGPPIRDARELARTDPATPATLRATDGGRVLVLGAGPGNEVALALARGAHHVDAVEADESLVILGRRRHPNQPYADLRVTTHVGDPRTYLDQTTARYDLVVVTTRIARASLPPTGTPGSSYALTVQALAKARDRLSPSGVLTLRYDSREEGLVRRLTATAAHVFDRRPCLHRLDAGLALTVAMTPEPDACPGGTLVTIDGSPPVTDDRPALGRHGTPWSALTVGALAALALTALVVGVHHARRRGSWLVHTGRVCGGAAGWLLGSVVVALACRRFGTTWSVWSATLVVLLAGLSLLVAAGAVAAARRRRPALRDDPVTGLGMGTLGALLGACLAYGVPVLGTGFAVTTVGVLLVIAGCAVVRGRRHTVAEAPSRPTEHPARQLVG